MDVLNKLLTRTERLKSAHQDASRAREALHDAERALATAEANHTLAGLQGKNEAARRAELAALTESEAADVVTADKEHRAAQVALTLAELDYRYAREALSLHRAQLLSRAPQEPLA